MHIKSYCSNFVITNATVLLENCKCVPDWEFDFSSIKFACSTFEKTVYYMILVDENGTPHVVEPSEYGFAVDKGNAMLAIER